MQNRNKWRALLAAAGFGFSACFAVYAHAEPIAASAKSVVDKPIVLAKFSKNKTHAEAKKRTKTADVKHGAKLADAASRGKSANDDDGKGLPVLPPSVANANASLTRGNSQSFSQSVTDDEARNIAAADDNEVVVMNGVQIASADQLNDMDRAVGDDKTDLTADDASAASTPAPAAPSGRIIRAVPSTERHVFSNQDNDRWNKTSLIGKIFVAFGSLLTLASAARLIVA